MNIVQDFSFIASTNVKQQTLESLLTVSPNTTMLDEVIPEDVTINASMPVQISRREWIAMSAIIAM